MQNNVYFSVWCKSQCGSLLPPNHIYYSKSFLLPHFSLTPNVFILVKPLQIKLLFPPLWFSNMPPAHSSMLSKTPWLKSSPHLLKTLVVGRISSSFQSIHQSNPEILENAEIANWLIRRITQIQPNAIQLWGTYLLFGPDFDTLRWRSKVVV